MNSQDITAYRIANQCISGSTLTPLEVVRHMGAMQAQDYNGALWSIGLRTGLTQKEVLSSIERRDIVRTWPQRGTLHFVPARDAKWLVGLSADRLLRGVQGRHDRLSINETILVKSKNALVKVLRGGKIVTRPKIMEVLERAGINTEDGRGYHLLWYLSQTGVLVAGPMEGTQQTFTLLEEWVKDSVVLNREESLAELARRYFISHGPATMQDFMWWAGVTSKDAKIGLELSKQYLVSEKGEGKEYWMKKGIKPPSASSAAYLLPGFDEYMLGYKDRGAALPAEYSNRIVPGGNGMFLSTIVIAGQVVGTWKKEIKKDRLIIKLSPFRTLTKADMKLLEIPAEQYARFLGSFNSIEIE